MAIAVYKSLFEAGGGTPMAESARWIEGVMPGEIALGLCMIAVALVGALTLTGRLLPHEGMRFVVGGYVLLGAPTIAAGSCREFWRKEGHIAASARQPEGQDCAARCSACLE